MTTEVPPSRKTSSPASRGFVNGIGMTNGLRSGRGMTNGRGRTNGLTNGLGRVNGTGLTNGLKGRTNGLRGRTNGLTNGIVNGNGLVNGRGLVNGTRRPLRSNVFGVVTHKDIRIGVSLTLLFVLFLPSFYLLMSLPAPSAPVIRIDGTFGDWAGVSTYIEDSAGTLDSIDFARYALYDGGDDAYFFFQVRGQLFPGANNYDGFCAFIDGDGNPDTGYWPGDLGAEYAVRVLGTDGKLTSAGLLRFESAQDRLNWTAWKSVSVVSAAASISSVEFAVYTRGLNLGSGYSVRLAGDDFEGHAGLASFRMGRTPGSLRIEQSPRTSLTPLTPSSNDMLHLTFQAQGGDVDIPNLAASIQWEAYPPNLASRLQIPNRLNIKAGEEVSVIVGLDTSGFAPMSPVWLNLTGLSVPVPLTIIGSGGVGYVAQLPQRKIADGWFGDWQTGLSDDTSSPLSNANVDVKAYSSNVTRAAGYEKALFYAEFRGEAMAGSSIPARIQRVQAGQPSPPVTPRPLKRVAGEDRLMVYVDSNSTDSQGCRIGQMTADFRLEFIGHRRRVDTSSLSTCNGGDWNVITSANPVAFVSAAKMEMAIDLSSLGTLDNPKILMESTDWSGIGDMLPLTDLGTRSGDGGTRGNDPPRVLHGVNAETAVSLELFSDPTLDGHCDDTAYDDAGKVSKSEYEFVVGHRATVPPWVWICITHYDSTNDTQDSAEIVFDTMHDGTEFPQTDDRHYRINSNQNGPLVRERGDGSGWVPCGNQCNNDQAASAFDPDNNRQRYEFRIALTNVWNPANTTGQAGFAIHLHNATGPHEDYWGSDSVNIDQPNTWGHLDIPEFSAIIVPFLVAVAISRPRRKRCRA